MKREFYRFFFFSLGSFFSLFSSKEKSRMFFVLILQQFIHCQCFPRDPFTVSLFFPIFFAPGGEGKARRRNPGLTLFLHLRSKNGRISNFFWLPPFFIAVSLEKKMKNCSSKLFFFFFLHLLMSINREHACWWHGVCKPEIIGAVWTRVHLHLSNQICKPPSPLRWRFGPVHRWGTSWRC